MKKLFILGLIVLSLGMVYGQSYTATIGIGEVNFKELNIGDEVIVPVRLVEKSGGKLAGFQVFVDFDHNILSWKGTPEAPVPGVKSTNKKLPMDQSSWVFNDNGSQVVAIWIPSGFEEVDLANGDTIIEFAFIYKGGLKPGEKSLLSFGKTYEVNGGIVVKGPTEFVSEKLDNYELTYQDGYVMIILK